MNKILSLFFIFLISLYQKLISPALPKSCIFHPTCSEYARQAILKKGVLRGLFLGCKRLLRCNGWNLGGYDPVE